MKTPHEKLTKIRAEVAGLVVEREEIEAAPIPRSECEAMIERVIAAPATDTVLNPGGPNSRVDLDPAPSGLLNGTFDATELLQTLGRPSVLRAVIPGAIKEYLIGLFDMELDGDVPGLPLAERRAKLKELTAKIFRLEVDEESICESLEADGADVQRRGDADPIAQLGLDAA